MTEVKNKLRLVRKVLAAHELAAVRFKGVDWFSWITGGGSSVVILTAEVGVAEVLVTATDAWVLTDAIERMRLAEEQVPRDFALWARPWETPAQTEQFVRDHTRLGTVASDRPGTGEVPLPPELIAAKRQLLPDEVARYRQLGADAAKAMTEALRAARPEWTEHQLAGAGAAALWGRGIYPTLTLAAGESRVSRYRHPVATAAKLAGCAMLVFCGQRYGLYANLTRWVFFREPTRHERHLMQTVATVEAAAFAASQPGVPLQTVYQALAAAYERAGFPGECSHHHQGGTAGYLSREVVATPTTETTIEDNTALAWNPSLPGAKIEDTVLLSDGQIDVLTVDPQWPVVTIEGRARPEVLVKP